MKADGMAVWQFDLYLAAGIEKLPDILDDGWQPPILAEDSVQHARRLLEHYLGRHWRLAERWQVFGPENGNRIDLISETPSTTSVVARFDLRDSSIQFQGLVCTLAKTLTCELFSPDLNAIIQPDRNALRMALADICAASH
ncbi:hypothetical protein [Duganella levis]|uniref:Uncharacterized protein n=1 Tax=Duganella levis TaxID=2692169 RepID=A0ABW9VT84_9BURK|nr:hypothetical protein [Duganella levis]MYN24845.1 hypothetical protein [Duganella levis]